MAKKTKSVKDKKRKETKNNEAGIPGLTAGLPPNLPPEVEEKLKSLKTKLDKFKDKVLEKFGDYIVGITLLPPEKAKREEAKEDPEEGKDKKEDKEDSKDKIHLLVVVDDTTSKKMTKDELYTKFSTIIKKIGEETDKDLSAQSALLTDIWQSCYDAKYDLNRMISLGAPIYDTGVLAAIKIAEIHKSMVIKKFEKYILSYVLAGSLTQGR